ncbi:esterase family protein [Thalassomonas viridans]|uniref:Esterase family protein n=1 Tax=Thalassomonas viridans TaxID=137584 RepID=A0AAF0CC17_9GAMM|nr:alpha/beta hydrolase-fold protein [Thalassomonas viridans]WDE07575.1 esterase family protein [Thalassomonas viridans]
MSGKKLLLLLWLSILFSGPGAFAGEKEANGIHRPAQTTKVSVGSLFEIGNFPSAYVDPRKVQIWLPPGYQEKQRQGGRYAVLYMHDGQMLFDGKTTWNGQEWGLDESAGLLQSGGKIKDFIVVGIFNGGADRRSEYFPQKAFLSLPKQTQAELYRGERRPGEALFSRPVNSDAYLKFIVHELKPYIDQHFAVKTDREHTYIMGASMGGLISLYALTEYPDVFGGAACLSTHWPGVAPSDDNPVPASFYAYLKKHLPKAGEHKLYFDFGTETLDAFYPPLQWQVDKILQSKGYDVGNWLTKEFTGAEHNEDAWRSRLHIPLTFLLAQP